MKLLLEIKFDDCMFKLLEPEKAYLFLGEITFKLNQQEIKI